MSRQPPRTDRPIVLVSNRGPVSFERNAAGTLTSRRGAGGLVSGIGPLVAGTDAEWLAAAISDGDREAAAQGVVEADGFRVRLLAIDPETYRLAYDVVSNEVLWFAHHGLWDLSRQPAFDRSWPDAWDAYRQVNRAFADAVAADAPQGAVVLVQDYHLCLVAARLAKVRPDLVCVHFSHTPFAPPVFLEALPDATVGELLTGMAAHRACGFHTQRWADDFTSSARDLAGLTPTTFVSPLASDPDDIRAAAASPACGDALAALDALVGDRAVIGRVDRMELSKNLLRGFLAYGDLLDRYPEHRERVVFVAAAYQSRVGVPGYAAYREDIEAAVAAINDALRHRQLDPGRARRGRRLPPFGRGHAPGRRAPRQPHPRRPQPGGVGGCLGERPRRSAGPVARSGCLGAPPPRGAARAPLRRGRHRRRAPRRAHHAGRRARPPRQAAP